MVSNFVNSTLSGIYSSSIDAIPSQYVDLIRLGIYTILIAIYAIFVWKFYKFLAKRDILELNLRQYNRTERPVLNKVLASALYFVEYLVVMPLLVFFWFAILAIFLLILSEVASVGQILLISGAIVAATRITAYYSGDLSKDLAKMFPFMVLTIFLLNPNFFNVYNLIERIVVIPELLSSVLSYLIFIFVVEIIMRGLFTIVDLFSSEEEREEVKNAEAGQTQ